MGLTAAAGALPQSLFERSRSAERPNIVLMMSDDQGWGDVAYNGHPELKTPNLNRMANAGLRFNRWYSGAPVCSPTRGSALTGRHPYRYGIFNPNTGRMPAQEVTLAEALKAQGYATGHFGKWHLGTLSTVVKDSNRGGPGTEEIYSPPWENGFDVCFSTESRMPTYNPMVSPSLEAGPLRRGQEPGKSFQSYYWTGPGSIATKNLAGDDSRVIMDRVVPFARQAVENEQPFFAVVWFHAPHEPVVAGPRHRAMYSQYSEDKQHYYGVVTALDEQIGRLRGLLQELGAAENTMLWFTSDNGPAPKRVSSRCKGSPGPFRGRKGSLYEGGVRVPGLLEWPARVKPGITDVPCSTSDYFPTVLDLLGFQMESQPEPIDGVSLRPLLEGQVDQRPRPIAFQQHHQVSLTDNRYKLISTAKENKSYELYDLLKDPSETANMALKKPEVKQQMKKKLEDWIASCEKSRSGADY